MNDLYHRRRLLWALAIVFVVVSLSMLGVRTLVPPDEGRYAEMAREMFASGDWITTRLNGIKYFEKPPLQTWMTALAYSCFGVGEWQARLWTGLCGVFGVFATGYTGWRLYGPRAGIDASLVLDRYGVGDAVQGTDRHRPAGRDPGALHARSARLVDVAPPASWQRCSAVPCHRRAMVRAGRGA